MRSKFNSKSFVFLFISLLFNVVQTHAQDVDDIDDLSLEELMNMEVSVATGTNQNIRETPGIVTVVTESDIQNSGARDLLDVLRLVPGVNFAHDVQGVVGISMRGNWGHEGKVLLMIDGQEINENLYSTTQFGNHYDVNQIKRIEIIRGPGSSIYGGYAELGVINVITRSGEELNGVKVSGTYGLMSESFGRRNVSVSLGDKKNEFEYSLGIFSGQGNRSEEVFEDWYGGETDLTNNQDIDPFNVNLGLKYKGLSVRAIYDLYDVNTRMFFDEAFSETQKQSFESFNGEIKYDFKISEKFTLMPKHNYVYNQPYNTGNNINFAYEVESIKNTSGLHSEWKPLENLDVNIGYEYVNEFGRNDEPYFEDGTSKTISFYSNSVYAQGLYNTKFGNVTLGGRYLNHSQFGSVFAPRFGYTKVFDKLHAKLLLSRAFRAPGIENINAAESIDTERTDVAEFEIGYQINENMTLTGNVFNIVIDDPIVYFFDLVTEAEGYFNDDQAGSRGFELVYNVKFDQLYLTTNYAYYTSAGINKTETYEVPTDDRAVLGLPQHTLNFSLNYEINDQISINPSGSWYGERYSIRSVTDDENEDPIFGQENPTFLLHTNVNFNNLFDTGLSASLAIYDILDENIEYIQPYNNFLAPLPGGGRELVIKLTYDLAFEG